MGIISTGKGVARVKSKLGKSTQHIPRLRGWGTKGQEREWGENKAQGALGAQSGPLKESQ